jgi:uncharacterized protein (TIGR02391 family)
MKLWEHDAAEILALPLDVLALLILADFAPDGWNVDSYFKTCQSSHSSPYEAEGVEQRFADAWAYLESQAFVGWHPRGQSAYAREITTLGREALAKGGLARVRAGQRLGMDLHPLIAGTVRSQFLLGEYELATFAAMKAVEVRVRELGGFPDDQIGVPLMAAAFRVKDPPGPLTRTDLEGGEQEAMMALFRGAIGTFKNPSSHRPVNYADPTLTAEVVLLADLLLRLLDGHA